MLVAPTSGRQALLFPNQMEAFFASTGIVALAEMGDKTQIATVMMAAHYGAPIIVVIGTTLGMLIADVPAVFIGDKLSGKLPLRQIRLLAAALFALLGAATVLGL